MSKWFDILPMTKINQRLFVGGMAASNELADSNPHGITAVLNVHQDEDQKRNPAIIYKHIPFEDGEAIPLKEFSECLNWLKEMSDSGHVILIHCAAGISRSVTIAASFMHHSGALQFDLALNHIKRARTWRGVTVANPAPATEISAKQMLKIWPYDGSMQENKMADDHLVHKFVWMDAARLAAAHPDDRCPMKLFLLAEDDTDNRPRHTILCTCGIPVPEWPIRSK